MVVLPVLSAYALHLHSVCNKHNHTLFQSLQAIGGFVFTEIYFFNILTIKLVCLSLQDLLANQVNTRKIKNNSNKQFSKNK